MLFISPCTIYLNTKEKGHLFALLNDVTDVENAVKSHHVVDEGIVGNPVHVHEHTVRIRIQTIISMQVKKCVWPQHISKRI